MKKNNILDKFIRQKWLVILALCALIVIAGTGSFAAYTNQNSVKRVVSTQMDSGLAFSSNYLIQLGTEEGRNLYSKKIFYVAEGETLTRFITVCNYPQSDPTYINEKNIGYKVVAALVLADTESGMIPVTKDTVLYTAEGGEHKPEVTDGHLAGYYVTVGGVDYYFDAATGTVEITGRLLGKNVLQADNIGLSVNGNYKDYVDVVFEVIPEDEASKDATNHYKLTRIFHYMMSEGDTARWEGEFADEYAQNNSKVRTLDGFNYDISGSGKGEVSLIWNSNYVEISPWFISDIEKELGETVTVSDGENPGEKKIVFKVGGVMQADSYSVQFYRTVKANDREGYGLYAAGRYSVGITGSNGDIPISEPYVRFSFAPDEL